MASHSPNSVSQQTGSWLQTLAAQGSHDGVTATPAVQRLCPHDGDPHWELPHTDPTSLTHAAPQVLEQHDAFDRTDHRHARIAGRDELGARHAHAVRARGPAAGARRRAGAGRGARAGAGRGARGRRAGAGRGAGAGRRAGAGRACWCWSRCSWTTSWCWSRCWCWTTRRRPPTWRCWTTRRRCRTRWRTRRRRCCSRSTARRRPSSNIRRAPPFPPGGPRRRPPLPPREPSWPASSVVPWAQLAARETPKTTETRTREPTAMGTLISTDHASPGGSSSAPCDSGQLRLTSGLAAPRKTPRSLASASTRSARAVAAQHERAGGEAVQVAVVPDVGGDVEEGHARVELREELDAAALLLGEQDVERLADHGGRAAARDRARGGAGDPRGGRRWR